MAVALQDEELIDKLWNGYGGWFWFFDQYLADGFYMEEFAKYYSNIGTMMLICEGLERLAWATSTVMVMSQKAAPRCVISLYAAAYSFYSLIYLEDVQYSGSSHG